MSRSLIVNEGLIIPANEIKLSFARSSGPGGQNVNKVNSKAVLVWNPTTSQALPEDVRSRFLQKYLTRLNKSGEIVLSSERNREQLRNTVDCFEKLRQLILSVHSRPRIRRPTRASRSSIERRLEKKRLKSRKKQERRRSWGNDG